MIDPIYVIYKDGEFFQTARDIWEAQRNVSDNIDCMSERDEWSRYKVCAYCPMYEVQVGPT